MAKVLDLCGHKYGKLSPVRFIGRDKHGHRVKLEEIHYGRKKQDNIV